MQFTANGCVQFWTPRPSQIAAHFRPVRARLTPQVKPRQQAAPGTERNRLFDVAGVWIDAAPSLHRRPAKQGLMFSSAMITVAREVSNHRWRDDAGAYARQEVQISQAIDSATVVGLSGTRRELGPHTVRVLSPVVFSEAELAAYLAASTKCVPVDEFLSAMVVTEYDWGKLVEIDWTSLDYCPGGLHYYLLPSGHPVIDLAGLRLDWPSVEVIPYRNKSIPPL